MEGFWRFPIDGGLVVARPDSAFLHCLNPTAGIIWDAGTRYEAVSRLTQQFGISSELARTDVDECFREWEASGLFTERRAEASAPEIEDAAVCWEICCSVEGGTFRVETDFMPFADEIGPRLGPIIVEPRRPETNIGVWRTHDGGLAIFVAGEWISTERTVQEARVIVLQELVRRAKAGRKWLAVLHAAACADDDDCVLLCGPSYCGKSMLSAALSGSGFAVLSDDFAGLEETTLAITPTPFPIALRSPDGGARFIETSAAGPARCRALVFSQWSRDGELRLAPVGTMDAIARLSECGFWVQHDEASIREFLKWVSEVPKYSLSYSSSECAVHQIKLMLDVARKGR